jgi:hypothetical protein
VEPEAVDTGVEELAAGVPTEGVLAALPVPLVTLTSGGSGVAR